MTMVKTIRILFMMLFVVGLVQAGETPDAEQILARYVDATGGEAAYEKIGNRVTKSTLEMPAQGISMDMTIYHSRPNSFYALIESELTGKIERGTDGEIAWEKTVMMGPRILEGQEKEDLLRQATFDQLVRWKELYEKAEAVGTEEVNGRPCDKVVLTPKSGNPQTYSFDRESGLLTKVALNVESPMGVVPVVTYLEDYKSVEGLLMPFRSRMESLGTERVVTVKSVEHNVDLPADRFAVPPEVLALK
jgi:outer membrane lipoprotein-sorting protein